MDGSRFDQLARSLSAGGSRRSFVGRLLAGAGGAVAAVLAQEAEAAPNRCAVYCSQHYPKGPAQAACKQACKQCGADVSRLCEGPTSIACCETPDACHTQGCSDGTCVYAPIDCDDGVACTIDSCDPVAGCVHTPDDSLCDTGNECRTGVCFSDSGCGSVPVDDGIPCADGAGVCEAGICSAARVCHALFAPPGTGTFTCPTGATEFCTSGPLDPTNSDQARDACEACYGVCSCFLEFIDCAGGGWGPNPPGQFVCGDAYFGYQEGCSGDSGRAWPICDSYTTFGYWGKN